MLLRRAAPLKKELKEQNNNMTENFSIFDAVPMEQKNFFKFENVNDSIEGTYIKRTDGIPNKFGQIQTIVDLLQSNGEVMSVSIGSTKTRLLEELSNIQLGQIIGFKFIASKPSSFGNPSKIIKIVHDAMYVNKAWIAEQEAKTKAFEEQLSSVGEKIAVNPAITLPIDPKVIFPENNMKPSNTIPAGAENATNKLAIITELAGAKFKVADLEELKNKIMEFTGFALIPSKYDDIIAKLS